VELLHIDSCYLLSDRSEFPCPYFDDGRINRLKMVLPLNLTPEIFEKFMERGYRRSSSFLYKNRCLSCRSCIPIRIRVPDFKPGKSQKAALQKNPDITFKISKTELDDQKLSLYKSYVEAFHNSKETADIRAEAESIHYGYSGTFEMDYYLEGRLIGVSIIDGSPGALSSVYFYHHPDIRARRPGIFSILKEIETAREMGKAYYYLGYYIENISKMSYKKAFKPYELFIKGKWV
jgi:leucyl-tRNA---protein transferase